MEARQAPKTAPHRDQPRYRCHYEGAQAKKAYSGGAMSLA